MGSKEIELTEDGYEEKLNEIYGGIDVCGLSYPAGAVLREIDPTAFRVGMADEPARYECDECGTEYDDEDEANECCTV